MAVGLIGAVSALLCKLRPLSQYRTFSCLVVFGGGCFIAGGFVFYEKCYWMIFLSLVSVQTAYIFFGLPAASVSLEGSESTNPTL